MSFRLFKYSILLSILNGKNDTEEIFKIFNKKWNKSVREYLKSEKTNLAIKKEFENLPIDEIKWPSEDIPVNGIFQTSPLIWTAIPISPKEWFHFKVISNLPNFFFRPCSYRLQSKNFDLTKSLYKLSYRDVPNELTLPQWYRNMIMILIFDINKNFEKR